MCVLNIMTALIFDVKHIFLRTNNQTFRGRKPISGVGQKPPPSLPPTLKCNVKRAFKRTVYSAFGENPGHDP